MHLHDDPRTIIGHRKDGRPIYLIQGGSGEGDQGGNASGDGSASGSAADGKPAGAAADAKPADAAGKPADAAGGGDLQGKYDGQLTVNRNLETQLNQLKDGLKAALGVPDKKVATEDLVSQLQAQVEQFAHTNAVNDVARRHSITSDDDLALLSTIKDKDAMEKFAARLAPKGDDGSTDSGKPRRPRPDPSQGGGRSGDHDGKRPVTVASAREAYIASRQKTNTP